MLPFFDFYFSIGKLLEADTQTRKLAERISGMEVSIQNVSSLYHLTGISTGDESFMLK